MGEPAVQWHVTEGDKVELLRGHFHVPEFDLPQRTYSVRRPTPHAVTRYFAERQPIGLQGDPPTIHFVYLATTERVQGFEHFLWQHAPLFRHLLRWTVVITYPPAVGDVSRYRRAFDTFAKRWPRCDALRDLDAVRWYFKKRRALDQRDWPSIALTDAPRFQKLRRRLSNERTEMLYCRWLTDGDAAFEHPAMPASPCGDLAMQRLDYSYDQFGQLPGECSRGRRPNCWSLTRWPLWYRQRICVPDETFSREVIECTSVEAEGASPGGGGLCRRRGQGRGQGHRGSDPPFRGGPCPSASRRCGGP